MKRVLIIVAVIFVSAYFILFEKKYYNETLYLGASIPKTGIMKDWGRNVEIGTNAYFEYVNEKDLLPNKKKIKLISLDDKYEPNITVENTEKLLENNDLFAFYGYVGTPTVKKILPIIEETKLPFIAPFTGASFLRDKKNENIINFRPSYDEEIDKIVDYLYEKKGIKKFSVFYQNDNYGEEGYVSLIKSLRRKGLALFGEGMYKRNTLSIKHAFSEIKNNTPEAIVMIGAYKANALFIKKAKEDEKLKNAIFCNVSFSDADEIIKELDYETENLIFSQVVPSFDDQKVDVIKEYRYIMNRYYPNEPLSFISLEAFLASKTIVESIKRVKGTLSTSKFMDQIKHLPKNSLKGMNLEYKDNQLLSKVYLFKYKDKKFIELDNAD